MAASAYLLKVHLPDPGAERWRFERQKTMYGGKQIAVGDTVYVFDSENEGGKGLVAVARVLGVAAVARVEGLERQTPRVSLDLVRTGVATRRLGRTELKPFTHWDDGRPETELNFKCYRQATNKLVGLSPLAAEFLAGHVSEAPP